MKKLLLSVILLSVGIISYGQIYVNINATGANNGTSWADAYTDLHDALFNTTSGEIWVAQGTYIPSKSFTGNIPGNNSQKTFRVKFNVQVYGGFNGTETSLFQRNWNTNQTIISGLVAAGVKAYNVVRFDANDNTTIFDGFIIENGQANGTTEQFGGGAFLANNSSPTIQNCTFRNNSAQQHGGAVHATGGNPNFFNCKFLNNSTVLYDAGAIYITTATNANIANCLFESNIATRYAGAILIVNTNSSYISNCTFVKNQRGSGTGNSIFFSQTTGSPLLTVSNCIFYGNLPAGEAEISRNGSGGSYSVKNSFSANGATDYISSSAQNNVITGNPFFVDYSNGDYNLQCRSTCVNSGDATGLTIPSTDLNNNPRTNGTSIDMGAFENNVTNIGIEANKTSICAGDFVILRGTCDATGYNWDNGITDGVAFYPTATNTYTCTGINSSTSDQITIEVLNITDEAVNAPNSVCSGSSTTVNLANSALGANYFLVENNSGFIIDGPLTGTGSSLNFTTNNISNTTTYTVIGSSSPETTSPDNIALDFDGTNDRVLTNYILTLRNTFTIEAKVFPRSTNYDRIISNFSNGVEGNWGIDTYHATNNGRGLRFFYYGAGNALYQISAQNALTLNTWNHIAVTFNNGTVKLFVNGIQQLQGSIPHAAIPKSISNFMCFGEDYTVGTAEYLNGKLDEVRIWDTDKSSAEILSNMNNCLIGNEPGLMAYYNFNDGVGSTTVTNLVSAINGDGALQNMDPFTDWVAGQPIACGVRVKPENTTGYALDFAGTNDRVVTSFKMPATSNFSIETWVYPRSTNYDRIISNNVSATNGTIIIDTYNTTDNGRGIRFNVYGTGNALFNISAANALTLNAWNHVACTFENGLMIIYVNGFEVVNGSAPFSSIPQITPSFVFGEDNIVGVAEYLNGKMDEVRFWNKALTQSEIMAGMNNCFIGTETDLLAYYNFEDGANTIVSDLTYNQNDGIMYNMDPMSDWVEGQFTCSASCAQEMTQTVTIAPVSVDLTTISNGSTITANQNGASYRWLDCNNSYAVISGEVSQSYTATTNGSFAVEVTLNGCTDTSACVNMTTVGIQQINVINMSISPNPVKNVLNINTEEKINKLSVYNINGSLIQTFENANNNIDVSHLTKGMYILVVQSEKGISQTKFIKE